MRQTQNEYAAFEDILKILQKEFSTEEAENPLSIIDAGDRTSQINFQINARPATKSTV